MCYWTVFELYQQCDRLVLQFGFAPSFHNKIDWSLFIAFSPAGKQGLWLHFLHSAARRHCQAGSSPGLRRLGGPWVQGGPRNHLEGEPERAQWWPEVSRSPRYCHRAALHSLSHVTELFCYRSLVALSLILAMLLFKPAPIYILDEVDAALDLSHTQNIGQMLRSHFRHSQVLPKISALTT